MGTLLNLHVKGSYFSPVRKMHSTESTEQKPVEIPIAQTLRMPPGIPDFSWMPVVSALTMLASHSIPFKR